MVSGEDETAANSTAMSGRRSSRKRVSTQHFAPPDVSPSPSSRAAKRTKLTAAAAKFAKTKTKTKISKTVKKKKSVTSTDETSGSKRASNPTKKKMKSSANDEEASEAQNISGHDEDMDTKSVGTDADDEIREEEEDEDVEEQIPEPNYTQGEQVYARDQDGLLYPAFIRRSIYGQHHHKQVQVGMVSSQEELEAQLGQEEGNDEKDSKSWHYFVHFMKWKVNWDRWVSEDAVLKFTPDNGTLQSRLITEHRKLQHHFKAAQKTTSGRKIDGGSFLKAWKKKLDETVADHYEQLGIQNPADKGATTNSKKKNKKKKKTVSSRPSAKALAREYESQSNSLLTNRQANRNTASSLVLAFGLKRLLVEEWEVMSQFDMVHPLPADTSIRAMLNDYLASKGVVAADSPSTSPTETAADEAGSQPSSNDGQLEPTSDKKPVNSGVASPVRGGMDAAGTVTVANDVKDEMSPETAKQKSTESIENDREGTVGIVDKEAEDEKRRRQKEWSDMAKGICILFDQALPYRLVYPCEQSQLTVLEQEHELTPSELYGCEHFLRLLVQLPALLDDTYRPKDQDGASALVEEDYDDLVKPILAKVNDLCRFLVKHQDKYFPQRFRKKVEEELKIEQKWAKKKERQRAAAAAMLAPSVAPGGTEDIVIGEE